MALTDNTEWDWEDLTGRWDDHDPQDFIDTDHSGKLAKVIFTSYDSDGHGMGERFWVKLGYKAEDGYVSQAINETSVHDWGQVLRVPFNAIMFTEEDK